LGTPTTGHRGEEELLIKKGAGDAKMKGDYAKANLKKERRD